MLSTENPYRKKPASLLRQAARAASEARDADGRSFGRLLGDSVSRSVQTLMMTGGHIIIFAVLISVLAEYLFHAVPVYLLPWMLEIHLGAQAVSSAVFGSSALQMAVLSAVLAWSGISAHFQTLAAVKAKGISWLKFAMQRLLQAVVAFLLALLLWKPSGLSQNTALPAFGPIPQAAMEQRDMFSLWSGLHIVLQWQLAMALSIAIVLYAVSRIISRVYP